MKKRGCPKAVLDDDDLEIIRAQLEKESHTSVRAMTEILGGKCGKSSVHKAYKKLGLTFKKTLALTSEIVRTLSGKEPNGWNGARTVIRNCLSLLTNLRQKLICLRYVAGAPEINVAMITRPRVGVRRRCFHLCVMMGRQSTLSSVVA